MADTPLNQNLSKIIEERIRWADEEAKRSLEEYSYQKCQEMYKYASALHLLYDVVKMKAPEVLSEIEKLVVRDREVDWYNIHKLKAIEEYIRGYISLIDDDKTRKRKIRKLKEALKQLSENKEVNHNLYELHENYENYLPKVESYLAEINKYLVDSTDRGLDWETKESVERNAAYNLMRTHIQCLLEHPRAYVKHLKAGDLDDFVRKYCEPIHR
jgi:DNA repair ATPase RecN